MAKRPSLDDKLAAVRLLRDRDPSPELTAELKTAIDDRIEPDRGRGGGDCRRFRPGRARPGAGGGLRSLPGRSPQERQALPGEAGGRPGPRQARVRGPDVFQKAARHVQLEPVWGGTEDTAAPLRAAALLALARIDVDDLLPLLVDALVDPQKDVRIAAAQALGYHGTEAAGLLLRLKVRLGDREPDVLSECLCGLLACAPKENLPLVAGYLDRDDIPFRRPPSSPWAGRACPTPSKRSARSGIVSRPSCCGRLFSLPWSCFACPWRPNS